MTRVRLDWLTEERRENVGSDVIQQTQVFHYSIPSFDERGDGAWQDGAEIESAKQLVRGGEVLISKLNPRKSRVLMTEPHEGLSVCSGEFVVLEPRPGVSARYLRYVLMSEHVRTSLAAQVRSVTRSQQRVEPAAVTKMWLDLQPADEHEAIADFLDAEIAAIDALIAEQKHLSGLASERLFAALTEGVDARVSGAPVSLEDGLARRRPEWELVPLRQIADVQSGVTLGKRWDEPTQTFPYLRVANVLDGRIDTSEVVTIDLPPAVAQRHTLRAGDVLMTEGGDNDKLGRGAIWSGEISGCLHQNHVFAVRAGSRLLPEYLEVLLASAWGRAYFQATAHQTTNLASTNRSKVGRFPVPLPPLAEQKQIVAHISSIRQSASALANETNRQIELLQEHRRALITTAVTMGVDAARRKVA